MAQPTPMEVEAGPVKDVKQLVQGRVVKFFTQLTKGCGRNPCENKYCASNPSVGPRVPNDAAAIAVQLARDSQWHDYVCIDTPPPVIASPASATTTQAAGGISSPSTNNARAAPTPAPAPAAVNPVIPAVPAAVLTLNFSMLQELLAEGMSSENYSALIKTIYAVFGSPASLERSFLKEGGTTSELDSGLDFASLQDSYKLIREAEVPALVNALSNGSEALLAQLKPAASRISRPEQLLPLLIVLHNPLIWDTINYKGILAPLVQSFAALSEPMRRVLIGWWSQLPTEQLLEFVRALQNFITLRIILPPYVKNINIDEPIIGAVKTLGLFNAVNDKSDRIAYSEFHNETINDAFEPREDLLAEIHKRGFSLLHAAFILDAASKARYLNFESAVSQVQERQNVLQTLLTHGQIGNPFVTIKIRREHLISDALAQLSTKSEEDLRKQLKVTFVGELAEDAGGVQKEFFQLLVREIFDAKYGMFLQLPTTGTFWFNSASGDFSEFTLIGQILGLAIYNGVILDARFPPVVYKKLMNITPCLDDLKHVNQELYDGLTKLLAFDGDVETGIGGTFQVAYEHPFEGIKYHNLKPKGDEIPVTNANRQEFVQLYAQWLLVESIKPQFDAFLKGFRMVCNSRVFWLFRPEELEMAVCGSPVLDFEALEEVTEYDGGFTKDHPVIRWFWEIVHSLTEAEKKRLLFFATGSDRAPVGGLSKLNFAISKHGEDSERLPQSHTCFNHMLLPAYSSKEKLEHGLRTAMSNAEGFGMI